jgi:hypothetical protein
MAFSLSEFFRTFVPELQPQTPQLENYDFATKIGAMKTKEEALAMISALTAMSTLGQNSAQNERLLNLAKAKAKLLGAKDTEIIAHENSAMSAPRL